MPVNSETSQGRLPNSALQSPTSRTFLLCPKLLRTEPPSKKMRVRKLSPTVWPFGALVLADDSGLEVDALSGAPGVHSARYAAEEPHTAECNTDDDANNARVLRELAEVSHERRTARFVCVLAAARNGQTVSTFRGTAEGIILESGRGSNGFGYDPLFYFPQIGKTFAELSPEEKAQYSHRGAAFRAFLSWCQGK